MGYSARIMIDTGAKEMTEVEHIGSYTSNLSGLWNEASKSAGVPTLREIAYKDVPCIEASIYLGEALKYLLDEYSAKYREWQKYEPDNGWGSIDSAIKFFKEIVSACTKHPKAVLYIEN